MDALLQLVEWAWDKSDKLGNLSQIYTALVASLALAFAAGQIWSARRGAREATLSELNRDQNRLCIELPRFANPNLGALDVDAGTFDGSPEKFEQYINFVIMGLIVCERAKTDGKAWEWGAAVDDFLKTHRQLLDAESFQKHWPMYHRKLRKAWHRVRK
jgi:hypothetical protein